MFVSTESSSLVAPLRGSANSYALTRSPRTLAGVSCDGAMALSKALGQPSCGLTSLHLNKNEIAGPGVVPVASVWQGGGWTDLILGHSLHVQAPVNTHLRTQTHTPPAHCPFGLCCVSVSGALALADAIIKRGTSSVPVALVDLSANAPLAGSSAAEQAVQLGYAPAKVATHTLANTMALNLHCPICTVFPSICTYVILWTIV